MLTCVCVAVASQVTKLQAMLSVALQWEAKARGVIVSLERSMLHVHSSLSGSLDGSGAAAAIVSSPPHSSSSSSSSASSATAFPHTLTFTGLRDLLLECEALPVVPLEEGMLRRAMDAAQTWLLTFAQALPGHSATPACVLACQVADGAVAVATPLPPAPVAVVVRDKVDKAEVVTEVEVGGDGGGDASAGGRSKRGKKATSVPVVGVCRVTLRKASWVRRRCRACAADWRRVGVAGVFVSDCVSLALIGRSACVPV